MGHITFTSTIEPSLLNPSFLLNVSTCLCFSNSIYTTLMGFPGVASSKEPACQCKRQKRCGFDPWVREIPWRRVWQPTPVFLPGESHGQRHLVGYIVHRVTQSQTQLKQLSMHASFSQDMRRHEESNADTWPNIKYFE